MRHLLMLLSLLLTTGTGWAQKPMFARKAVGKLQKELRLNRTAPAAAQRIQPAAAEYYYGQEISPSEYYKYDAWGNETEHCYISERGKQYKIQTWDNSHGYPVLLDSYSYTEFPDGTKSETEYDQRTIVNGDGVRTAIEDTNYEITLDGSGRVISYNYNRISDDDRFESCVMTWDGDMLATYKYDYNYVQYEEEEHMTLNNIQVVHQTKPFNAYEIDYYETFFSPEVYGTWINATGTYQNSRNTGSEPISGILEIRTEVSADKKIFITTTKVAGNLINKNTVVFIDGNGSYTAKMEYSNGDYEQVTRNYNEYGDLIEKASGHIERYEWEYDNGKPLQVKMYHDDSFLAALVFTAWHNSSSISTTNTDEARILGATLYTLDGTKVRTLAAEEAQAAETVCAPQNGIYILAVQTDRGTQTRKIVSVR